MKQPELPPVPFGKHMTTAPRLAIGDDEMAIRLIGFTPRDLVGVSFRWSAIPHGWDSLGLHARSLCVGSADTPAVEFVFFDGEPVRASDMLAGKTPPNRLPAPSYFRIKFTVEHGLKAGDYDMVHVRERMDEPSPT